MGKDVRESRPLNAGQGASAKEAGTNRKIWDRRKVRGKRDHLNTKAPPARETRNESKQSRGTLFIDCFTRETDWNSSLTRRAWRRFDSVTNPRKRNALPKCRSTCRRRHCCWGTGKFNGKREIRQHGDSARVIKSQVSLAARRQLCIPIWRQRHRGGMREGEQSSPWYVMVSRNSRLPYSYQILALNATSLASGKSWKSREDMQGATHVWPITFEYI